MRLMELVAQMIETHGYGRLAWPCIHALASAHQLGGFTHAQIELVLLRLSECVTKLACG